MECFLTLKKSRVLPRQKIALKLSSKDGETQGIEEYKEIWTKKSNMGVPIFHLDVLLNF